MPLVGNVGNVRIRVYLQDTGRHHRPHFHAASPDNEMIVGLPELDVIAGDLSPSSRRAVLAWAAENLGRLFHAWNVANPGTKAYLPDAGGPKT